MRLFTKARQRTLKSCEGRTVKISDNEFKVKNYTVYKSRKGWICECMHYVYKQTPCSHIVYVATHPQLMPVEVKHVPNRPNKVVLGYPENMHGFMAMLTLMSMLPLGLGGETIRVPPGSFGHW